MADFCRACTAMVFEVDDTDIVGPVWALCEGCGVHHFDIDGQRQCGLPVPDESEVTGEPCPMCRVAVG
jgi:hypothetical protein